tara:strand:- start:2427 stop:2918 length:492 start_codon:yes stop_codon:yes gene_type:complete
MGAMKNKKNTWFTGSGNSVEFDEILEAVKTHSLSNGLVSIGTDSHIKKRYCIFSSAICLHKSNDGQGGRYFFKKAEFKKQKFASLLHRITEEVRSSIEIGMRVLEYNPAANIELHIDISGPNKNHKTSKFADMLVGYATGAGFNCKIKPDAPAASSVADKHSK